MAKITRTYKMPHRRRREEKTDYRLRLELVKSGRPRFVIRRSVSHMIVQLVEFKLDGDKSILSVSSGLLSKSGWVGSTGNVPASYLTGYLAGLRAKRAGIDGAIVDLGMQRCTKGSRIYAVVKGLVDAGLDIPHDDKVLPGEDRILGKHIEGFKNNVEEIKGKLGE